METIDARGDMICRLTKNMLDLHDQIYEQLPGGVTQKKLNLKTAILNYQAEVYNIMKKEYPEMPTPLRLYCG